MTDGDRGPDAPPEGGGPPDRTHGWRWLPRIAAFTGIFVVALFLAMQVLALLGAPAPESADAGELLNVWNTMAMVFAGLAASWASQVGLSGRRFADLGLPGGPGALRQLVVGALLGVAVLGAVLLAMVAFGWVDWVGDGEPGSAAVAAAGLAIVLFGAAFVEELLFRGYPFQVIERRFGVIVALASTSVLFSAAHLLNPNATILSLVNIGLAGVLLGVAYWRTRSLWFATGVHAGWNWVMAVSELSVSGLDFEMPGFDPIVSGPDLLTGGAFGPEGGLLVSFASLAAIVWLWRWRPEVESLSRR